MVAAKAAFPMPPTKERREMSSFMMVRSGEGRRVRTGEGVNG
jgi:hypothetical protein